MPDDDRPDLVPRRMLDLCRDTLRLALVRTIRQERTIRRLRSEITRLRGILRKRRGMAMTDPVTGKELGSDEQMGDDRLEHIQRRLDFELAAIAEEEHKTQARPADGPG